MAKVSGAFFSLGASGTLAHTITVNQSSTQQIARKKPQGYAPASPMQAIIRNDMRQAATAWRALDPAERDEWRALAAPRAHTAFGKYYLEWVAQRATPATPPHVPMA